MKIWKEAKTVELDLAETKNLIIGGLDSLKMHIANCENIDDWEKIHNLLDDFQSIVEKVITRLGN